MAELFVLTLQISYTLNLDIMSACFTSKCLIVLQQITVGKFEEGMSRSSYWSETFFAHLILVTLSFNPVTPKCYPGSMCGTSLRKVDQGALDLLIRNEKVTDGPSKPPSHRPTCAKQYALSTSKRGIINSWYTLLVTVHAYRKHNIIDD